MAASDSETGRVAFGDFVLDAGERVLLRHGAAVDVLPRVFDALVVLASRPGQLVSKEDLMAEVWPGLVVSDTAVSVTISRLRTLLGDAGRHGRYVETVTGHGYRFVMPVEPTTGPATAATEAQPSQAPRLRRLLAPWLVAGSFLAVGAVALAASLRGDRPTGAGPLPPAAVGAAAPAGAEEAFQRGRAVLATRRNLNDAMQDFRLAVRLDPSHARAWAGLADVYSMAHSEPGLAESAARRAIALDPNLADAWASLGFALAFQSWKWADAEQALLRARRLDPSSTRPIQSLATVRMIQRRFGAAVSLLREALALEARPGLYADLCQAEYYGGRYADARVACARALRLDPDFGPTDYTLVHLALVTRRPADAAAALQRQGVIVAETTDFDALLRGLRTSMEDAGHGPNRHVARAEYSALLGDTEDALEAVELAVGERAFMTPFLNAEPTVDSIRDEPRFRAAMRSAGLDQGTP